ELVLDRLGGERGDRVLTHHAQHIGQVTRAVGAGVPPGHGDPAGHRAAGGVRDACAQGAQQRGLARTGGAHHEGEFAFRYVGADLVQDVSVPVADAEVVDLDHGLFLSGDATGTLSGDATGTRWGSTAGTRWGSMAGMASSATTASAAQPGASPAAGSQSARPEFQREASQAVAAARNPHAVVRLSGTPQLSGRYRVRCTAREARTLAPTANASPANSSSAGNTVC